MENPETLATLGDTGRRQTQYKKHHRKLKRWATRIPPETSSCLLLLVQSGRVGYHNAQNKRSNIWSPKQTTGVKTNRLTILCGNRSGNHYTQTNTDMTPRTNN